MDEKPSAELYKQHADQEQEAYNLWEGRDVGHQVTGPQERLMGISESTGAIPSAWWRPRVT